MPTYEYRCTACGEHLEVVQSFNDDALTECPACGGELRKVFGSIGITFKGSGFYKTDSRTSSASSSSSSSTRSSDSSGTKGETKSDTKGGTKSETKSGSSSSSSETKSA